MRKLIILGAVTSILVLGGSQQAWARGREHHNNNDYRAFKKIVRVLNAVINDGHQRGGTRVVFTTQRYPRKICHFRGSHKKCNYKRRGNGRYKQARHNNRGHSKKQYYNHR